MLVHHFLEDRARVEQPWAVEGLTSFGIRTFAAKVNARLVAQSLLHVGAGLLSLGARPGGEVLPEGAALAVEPSEAPESKKPGLGLGALAKVAGRLKQTDAQKADRDRRRKKRELLRHLKK